MSPRSRTAVLALAVGFSLISAAQAVEVANGLTSNGLTSNGLSANGLSANGLTSNGLTSNGLVVNGLSANGQDTEGRLRDATSGPARLEAVILQDGSVIPLQ